MSKRLPLPSHDKSSLPFHGVSMSKRLPLPSHDKSSLPFCGVSMCKRLPFVTFRYLSLPFAANRRLSLQFHGAACAVLSLPFVH